MNGGWSANDEASPHFDDIINNMMIGHEFLQKEFGVTPTIGWDIDTFGHSATNTRIYAELGYDAMFFSRLDHQEKDERNAHQSLNFLWRPDVKHFGSEYQVLTNVFKDDYCFPRGFYTGENYDSDDPFISDKSLSTFNADEKMVDFVNFVNDLTRNKKGQNIMIPMGCDFTYQNARSEFRQVERVIEYINQNNKRNMVLRMSTPSIYIDALKKENIKWPVKYDDAFPYSSDDNDFWVGYFTSRPGSKKQIKDASALLSAEMKLSSLSAIKKETSTKQLTQIMNAKQRMLEELSIYLHHDAITGTAKQYVANDYTDRMQKAVDLSMKTYTAQVEEILKHDTGYKASSLLKCTPLF